jgi:ATP-dependent DNA helicase RecG
VLIDEMHLSIQKLPGAGPKTAEALSKAGYTQIQDILSIIPKGYEDRTKILPLHQRTNSPAPYPVVSVVEILDHDYFGQKRHLKILVRDGSGLGSLLCFGRNFLARSLPIGSYFLLTGVFTRKGVEVQTTTFESEPLPQNLLAEFIPWIQGHSPQPKTNQPGTTNPPTTPGPDWPPPIPITRQFGTYLPRYPSIGGLGEQKIRSLVHKALDSYGKHLADPLPKTLLDLYSYPEFRAALTHLHHPKDLQQARKARERLAYEELFILQLRLAWTARQRKLLASQSQGTETDSVHHQQPDHPTSQPLDQGRPLAQQQAQPQSAQSQTPHLLDHPTIKQLLSSLGFGLTPDQIQVLEEMEREITGGVPMARLIQGDVGSGKTIVGLLAASYLATLGIQSVLMAPTELLARQHADNAYRILSPAGIRVGFLSGGLKTAPRKLLLQEIAQGRIDLLVGTHAVFTADVEFSNLGLSIVDEQHRFGVLQRTALQQKGKLVHLLLMSATPIPRTLAMTVYGDLDVSTIRTKPLGRKPIETHLARMGNEKKVYDFVQRQLDQGRQAYFVYPRIEASETDQPTDDSYGIESPQGLKSAEAMFDHLSNTIYPNLRVGLIHGQLKEEEKSKTMEDFAAGSIQVLVSTTVVEVGVDVPNATVMVIEHAERFGLAALHQLRGRVGRSSLQSYCFLVYHEPLTDTAKERLKIMKETNDGFLIAEKDLELRGPGDIQGIAQSGFLQFTYADLASDMGLMNRARKDAFDLLKSDPDLDQSQHLLLKELVERDLNPMPPQ